DFPMPDIPQDSALLKMEVGGICGTDVKMYEKPPSKGPVIMGHENIGYIAKAGREFTRRKGFREGDLVFVEHYVMCGQCEWCHLDGGVGYNSRVLIQGPGQQGLSQTVVCKQAGASLIIVTGTSKDRARMEVAKTLGADYVVDVEKEDALARTMEITGGKGVDVVLDCTTGAGTMPVLLGIDALKRKDGTIVVQGELAEFPNFPLAKITVKFITIKSARGHSYKACELALQQLVSHRFPLEKITTHTFGLKDVDLAIRSVGGQGLPDVIHASLLPWK